MRPQASQSIELTASRATRRAACEDDAVVPLTSVVRGDATSHPSRSASSCSAKPAARWTVLISSMPAALRVREPGTGTGDPATGPGSRACGRSPAAAAPCRGQASLSPRPSAAASSAERPGPAARSLAGRARGDEARAPGRRTRASSSLVRTAQSHLPYASARRNAAACATVRRRARRRPARREPGPVTRSTMKLRVRLQRRARRPCRRRPTRRRAGRARRDHPTTSACSTRQNLVPSFRSSHRCTRAVLRRLARTQDRRCVPHRDPRPRPGGDQRPIRA